MRGGAVQTRQKKFLIRNVTFAPQRSLILHQSFSSYSRSALMRALWLGMETARFARERRDRGDKELFSPRSQRPLR
jgi:hypothetical protein